MHDYCKGAEEVPFRNGPHIDPLFISRCVKSLILRLKAEFAGFSLENDRSVASAVSHER